jgi:glyoxylase-like metal-dependent hydrolase (beta-lactamase superfamily II)
VTGQNPQRPEVTGFYDPATSTISYVVADPATRRCAVIDPVLDYDPKSGRTATASADAVAAHVRANGLTADWLLETHVHADHLSAMPYLKRLLGGHSGIGARIGEVQAVFKKVFNVERDFHTDGRQFDHLFADGEQFAVGSIQARAISTPGHTPACMTFLIGDAAFVGDTLFMPDFGTARCDFPGGDAATLYRSIQRIYALPDATRLFMCHDYQPGGRAVQWETTVAEEKARNIHIRPEIAEAEFVAMRTARDRTLSMPVLILPSVQVNMRAGELPPAEDNGVRYLKIPLDTL